MSTLIPQIGNWISRHRSSHPLRVGIDGISAAGKSSIADQLAHYLTGQGREVHRSGMDAFYNPKEIRRKNTQDPVKGYVRDSFNYAAVLDSVLAPLGPQGSRRLTPAIYDFRTESEICPQPVIVSDASILLFEGVLLFPPVLTSHFDIKLYIDVSEEVAVKRACERDGSALKQADEIKDDFHKRYLPGQLSYREKCKVFDSVDFIIKNDNYQNPILEKSPF